MPLLTRYKVCILLVIIQLFIGRMVGAQYRPAIRGYYRYANKNDPNGLSIVIQNLSARPAYFMIALDGFKDSCWKDLAEDIASVGHKEILHLTPVGAGKTVTAAISLRETFWWYRGQRIDSIRFACYYSKKRAFDSLEGPIFLPAIKRAFIKPTSKDRFNREALRFVANIDIHNEPVDTILRRLKLASSGDRMSEKNYTPPVDSIQSWDRVTGKTSHQFIITENPIPGLALDSGYITTNITEYGSDKIFSADCQYSFVTRADAEKYVNAIIKVFTPISTTIQIDPKQAEPRLLYFRTNKESPDGLNSLSVSFYHREHDNKYLIDLTPFNQLK